MKSLIEHLKVNQWPSEKSVIFEMTTIGWLRLNKIDYRIAVHELGTKDIEIPHVHIYLAKDKDPFNKFNFEISLCDIFCKDKINLIKMRDEKNHIKKNNRTMCSWTGYTKLKNEFEDWLFSKSFKPWYIAFKDNLEAITYHYNLENGINSKNSIKDYIESRGWKVLPKYKAYVEDNDISKRWN